MGAGAVGWFIMAEAVAARIVLHADEAGIRVLGHPIGWVCAFRNRVGLPCPTCGLTRSLVLSLHGEIQRAWRVAPAGPVIACGLLALAGALLWLGFAQAAGSVKMEAGARWVIRYGMLVYTPVLIVTWIGGWAVSVAAAMRAV